MPLSEFDLIARYFTRPVGAGGMVRQGIGDDCALLDAGEGTLAVSTDMLLAGRHFFPDADPAAIGHKALAVNLSDLAAAGATPRCFFLALALPRADEVWLAAFARGMFALADRYGCVLAGGDTTRAPVVGGRDGPLTISITAVGEVPRAAAHSRAGARAGDQLWVSGTLGDAALALAHHAGTVVADAEAVRACRLRLDWPQPRVELGGALRGIASACIDVSDGLVGDLGHILARSQVGAEVQVAALPRSASLRAVAPELQHRCALAGGDDYELLFAAPPARRTAVLAAAEACGVAVTHIGRFTAGGGLVLLDVDGPVVDTRLQSYDHFAE